MLQQRVRPVREDERLQLYKIAVEEVRFNITLTWDRAKHFLVFNGVLLGAAPGLLKLTDSIAGDVLVAALLLLGAFHSAGGAHVVRVAHGYYREARDKLVEHERALGLFDNPEYAKLVVATTPGKAEAIEKQTGVHVRAAKRNLFGNVTDQICRLLWCVAALDAIGFACVVAKIVLALKGHP